MNDNKEKMEDRFYEKCEFEEKSSGFENPLKVAYGAKSVKAPKVHKMLEFAPEPPHMNEVRNRKLKFTVGKQYPVLDKQEYFRYPEATYRFETTDDEGNKVWVDEKFFIPATQFLYAEKDVGGWGPPKETDDGMKVKTDYEGPLPTDEKLKQLAQDAWKASMEVPDIRKEAEKQGVGKLGDVKTACGTVSSEDFESTCARVLSGLQPTQEFIKLDDNYNVKDEAYSTWSAKQFGHRSIYEGVVPDKGNELLYNLDKLMANMGKVFNEYATVDPDDILDSVRKALPTRKLIWNEGTLTVDGAKTTIRYEDAKKAFDGLKGFVSAKLADKAVSKIIVNKLKKLF
jgi:hypothetical protein